MPTLWVISRPLSSKTFASFSIACRSHCMIGRVKLVPSRQVRDRPLPLH
jgi:hypothetical protein